MTPLEGRVHIPQTGAMTPPEGRAQGRGEEELDKPDSKVLVVADLLTNQTALKAYLVIGGIYFLTALMVRKWTEAEELYADMEIALEVERPIHTRSDLAAVPILGHVFQAVCDLSDFVFFNGGLARKYIPAVPALLALPTCLGAISTLRNLLTLPTALAEYSASLRM